MAISRAIELVASNVTKIEIQKIIINKKKIPYYYLHRLLKLGESTQRVEESKSIPGCQYFFSQGHICLWWAKV